MNPYSAVTAQSNLTSKDSGSLENSSENSRGGIQGSCQGRHLFSLEVRGIKPGPLGMHSASELQTHPTVDTFTKAM